MNERDKTNVERIANEIAFIQNTVSNVTKDMFLNDEILQHALCMSILTIGECANHLSDGFIDAYDEIEWIEIIAVRNIAAHGYWQLNMEQIWQAVEDDIPKLKAFVHRLLCFL